MSKDKSTSRANGSFALHQPEHRAKRENPTPEQKAIDDLAKKEGITRMAAAERIAFAKNKPSDMEHRSDETIADSAATETQNHAT